LELFKKFHCGKVATLYFHEYIRILIDLIEVFTIRISDVNKYIAVVI